MVAFVAPKSNQLFMSHVRILLLKGPPDKAVPAVTADKQLIMCTALLSSVVQVRHSLPSEIDGSQAVAIEEANPALQSCERHEVLASSPKGSDRPLESLRDIEDLGTMCCIGYTLFPR